MKLLNKDIDLVIFDLDGTLIDSNSCWKKIDIAFFSKRNMILPRDYTKKIAHVGLEEAAKITKNEYKLDESIEDIQKEWRDGAINFYTNIVKLKPYAKKFIQYLKKNKVKVALATANTEKLYKPCLVRLGIYDMFDFISDVDKVPSGKATATIYNTVTNNLNCKVENTIVIEDIVKCLKTAKEAGYTTIGVYDKYNDPNDYDNMLKYSDKYIKSYNELLKTL